VDGQRYGRRYGGVEKRKTERRQALTIWGLRCKGTAPVVLIVKLNKKRK